MLPGSANKKIVRVNQQMGAKNINQQQGTTRTIYDSQRFIQTNAVQTLTFFENCNTRQFPFTNLTENKLQIGESIAFQRFSFQLMLVNRADFNNVRQILPFDNINGGTNALYRSDISLQIAQDTVIKKQPLHTMYAPFNKDSRFYGSVLVNINDPATEQNVGLPHDVFHLDNPIVLPPQIEFKLQMQICWNNVTIPANSEYFIMCTLEGLGSLYAPKSTY